MKNLLIITAIAGLTALSFTGCATSDTASNDYDLAPVAEGPAPAESFNQVQNNFELDQSSVSY